MFGYSNTAHCFYVVMHPIWHYPRILVHGGIISINDASHLALPMYSGARRHHISLMDPIWHVDAFLLALPVYSDSWRHQLYLLLLRHEALPSFYVLRRSAERSGSYVWFEVL